MALDPAVQGLIYCFIFLFMPLGKALIPLMLKEAVYLLWVTKEVLQIASPGVVCRDLISFVRVCFCDGRNRFLGNAPGYCRAGHKCLGVVRRLVDRSVMMPKKVTLLPQPTPEIR